jgi:hypothetical protein
VEIVGGSNAGRTSTTNSDGQYQFASLTAGEAVLRVSAQGHHSTTSSVVVQADTIADFPLKELGDAIQRRTLSGIVRGQSTSPAAQPLATARVMVKTGPDAGRSVATDVSGRYEIAGLAVEEITVEASAHGYVTETQRVDLNAADTRDFQLTAMPVDTVVVTGRLLDVLSQRPVPGATLSGEGLTAAPSDASGAFRATLSGGGSGARALDISSAATVTRRTYVSGPGPELLVTLIPGTFNLRAFDEMVRDPGLRRWSAAPPLIIERRPVQYTDVDMASGVTLDEEMTEGEVDALLADLAWALPQLTGGTFASFGGVTRRSSTPGTSTSVLNPGAITVTRVSGLEAATGKWGWSRWLYHDDGSVVGGVLLLDRDFDRTAGPYRRALRVHELGHALGYAHVTSAASVMHPAGRTEPTDFDRDATKIAFERKPGTRAPDIDPDPARAPRRHGAPRWTAAQP